MNNLNVFVGRFVLVLWMVFCQTLLSFASNLDSLLQATERMEPGVMQAKSYMELADECVRRALYTDALVHSKKALELQEEFGGTLDRAEAMVNLGVAHGNISDYDVGISWVEKGLGIFSSKRDEAGIASANTELGILLASAGRDDLLAKEYLMDALQYHHEHSNKQLLSRIYYALGRIASASDNGPAKTLKNYYKAIELRREIIQQSGSKKDNMLAGAYNNSGLVYLQAYENTLAIEYFNKALESLPEDGNVMFKGIMNFNLGVLHYRKSDFDAAHAHMSVAKDLNKAHGNEYFRDVVQAWRGRIFLAENRLDSARYCRDFILSRGEDVAPGHAINFTFLGDLSFAERDIEKAGNYYEAAMATNFNETGIFANDDVEAFLGASKCAKARGDLYKALELHEKYHLMLDSVMEVRRIPAISLSETREEMNLKEKEDRRRAQRDLQETRERNFLQYSAGLLLIVILLLLLNLVVKFTLPTLFIKGASFITVLTLFEFALVYLDPTIEEISAGEPLTKLGINLLIAVVIFPLHTFIEKRITKTNGRSE